MQSDTSKDEIREIRSQLKELEKRLEGLNTMMMDQLLSPDEYISMKEEMVSKKLRLMEEEKKITSSHSHILSTANKHLSLAKDIHIILENASIIEEKRILSEIGYNLLLKDKKVHILCPFWLLYLNDYKENIWAKKYRVQPTKSVVNKGESRAFEPLDSIRLAGLDPKQTDTHVLVDFYPN